VIRPSRSLVIGGGFLAAAVLAAFTSVGAFSGNARADNLQAKPWIFVGNAGDCGGTAGSNIVTSGWLGGLGLPDNGGNNGASATASDPHRGLLLNKNGLTTDCSSSGASIKGVKNMTVPATGLNLGYDYRNGGHCGAGAPRFNVSYTTPTNTSGSSFIGGCANSTPSPAPQDAEWTRVVANTSNPAQAFPVIPAGSKITSIDIVFDEGTDTPSVSDPNGVGLATIDNININGQTIASGNGVAEPHGPRGDKHDKNHGDDDDNGHGND